MNWVYICITVGLDCLEWSGKDFQDILGAVLICVG